MGDILDIAGMNDWAAAVAGGDGMVTVMPLDGSAPLGPFAGMLAAVGPVERGASTPLIGARTLSMWLATTATVDRCCAPDPQPGPSAPPDERRLAEKADDHAHTRPEDHAERDLLAEQQGRDDPKTATDPGTHADSDPSRRGSLVRTHVRSSMCGRQRKCEVQGRRRRVRFGLM
jgi:hypothetical protein